VIGRILLSGFLLSAIAATSAAAQSVTEFSCGVLRARAWRTMDGTMNVDHWRIEKVDAGVATEIDKRDFFEAGPSFSCRDGTMLIVTFDTISAHSFIDFHFPDGTAVGIDGKYAEQRGTGYVLPLQVKPRTPAAFRTWFSYHCQVHWDPLPAGVSRDECP
jgi:hypothetical protein